MMKLSEILNKPFFKSISDLFKEEVIDNINFPMENVYLDANSDEIESMSTRCMTLSTPMTVDYFNFTTEGDVLVSLNLLLKYAKKKKIEELVIPEGITYLFYSPGYVKYTGKIVFPSTLKVFSPLELSDFENSKLDYGVLTMNYKEPCEFGVLDFYKCNKLKVLLDDAFDNIKANEIILPESITEINCFFSDEIEKVYVNSLIHFNKNLTRNIILKDDRLYSFGIHFDDIYKDFSYDNLRDNIIVVANEDNDTPLYNNNIGCFKNLYYPVSDTKLNNDFSHIHSKLFKDGDVSSFVPSYEMNSDMKYHIRYHENTSNLLWRIERDLEKSYDIDRYGMSYIKGISSGFNLFLFAYMFDDFIDDHPCFLIHENAIFGLLHYTYNRFEEGQFYSIYIYDSDIDIDAYPVQNREYVQIYDYNNKVYIYLENGLTCYKLRK